MGKIPSRLVTNVVLDGPLTAAIVCAFAIATQLMWGWLSLSSIMWWWALVTSGGVVSVMLWCLCRMYLDDRYDANHTNNIHNTSHTSHTLPVIVDDGELVSLTRRADERNIIREFIIMHIHGRCCGQLDEDTIVRSLSNLNYTLKSLADFALNLDYPLPTRDRIVKMFDVVGESSNNIMNLAMAMMAHQDAYVCTQHVVDLCDKINSDPLLRDLYGC